MDQNTPRTEAERWLGTALKLLTARDFVGSKTFAIRAKESDPNNHVSDQILAVVETIMAGEKRVNSSQHPDWYSVLQLPRLVRDPELITNHYRRLVTLLSPERNRLPFVDYALQLVMDAWSILSDPGKKWLFDSELGVYLQQFVQQQQQTAVVQQSAAAVVASSSAAAAVAPPQVSTFEFFNQPPQPPQTVWQQQQNQEVRVSNNSNGNSSSVVSSNYNNLQQIEFMQMQSQPMQVAPQPQVGPQWQMRDPTPAKGGERNKGVVNGIGVTVPMTTVNTDANTPRIVTPVVNATMTRVVDGHVGNVGNAVMNNVFINDLVNYSGITNNVGVVHENNNVFSGNVDENINVVSGNVDVDDNVTGENDDEEEEEVEEEEEEVDVGETFWTSCPYCLYVFEYQKEYQELTLRCQNCRKGFQAVEIPNPPPISRTRDSGDKNKKNSFCCWGFFPLGFSTVAWKKHNGRGASNPGANWVPFSPVFASPGENGGGNYEWFANGSGGANIGPRSAGRPPVYQRKIYDIVDDDGDFDSDPSDSDSSDGDWRRKRGIEKKRKKHKRGKFRASRTPRKVNPQNGDVENQENANPVTETVVSACGEDLEKRANVQNDVGLNCGDKEDARKKVAAPIIRSQGRTSIKETGRLDLNAEVNNEGDEHAPRAKAVNRGEDGVENIEFFEGLDEFISTLPILNVGKNEKAKAT